MAGRFTLRPAVPRLRHGHSLVRGLVGCWMLTEGAGNVLRNLGSLGTGYDILVGTNHSLGRRDDAAGPAGYMGCANNNNNSAAYRGGSAIPNQGGTFTVDFRYQPRGQSDSTAYLFRQPFAGAVGTRGTGDATNNGKAHFKTNVSDLHSTTAMNNVSTNREWYHWTISYSQSASRARFYLNGALDVEHNFGSLGTFTPDLILPGGDRFVGLMDFFRLWNYELTPGAILELALDPYVILEPRRQWFYVGLAGGGPQPRAQALIF